MQYSRGFFSCSFCIFAAALNLIKVVIFSILFTHMLAGELFIPQIQISPTNKKMTFWQHKFQYNPHGGRILGLHWVSLTNKKGQGSVFIYTCGFWIPSYNQVTETEGWCVCLCYAIQISSFSHWWNMHFKHFSLPDSSWSTVSRCTAA